MVKRKADLKTLQLSKIKEEGVSHSVREGILQDVSSLFSLLLWPPVGYLYML